MEQEYEREPTPQELADSLEMSVEEIAETMRLAGKHLSVDAPLQQGEDNRLLDIIPNDQQTPPDGELIHESLRLELDHVLASLTDREAEVVRLYFGLDGNLLTLEEIGEKFGLTRERVRQIKEKAIRRLRHTTKSKVLKSFLGQ